MSHLTLILLAAGSSSRFGTGVKKQWLRVGDTPLWQFVADKFEGTGYFNKIIVTSSADDIEFMQNCASYTFVEGGARHGIFFKSCRCVILCAASSPKINSLLPPFATMALLSSVKSTSCKRALRNAEVSES